MLKCEYCGKEDDTVRDRFDPYDYEINDIKREIVICDDCYQQRADDI
jgi:hypothetical protein